MLRAAILALLLVGCDQTFGLRAVQYEPPPPDAPADAAPDAPPYYLGCSDASREGFVDAAVYPDIAACAGAWSLPGLRDVVPACDRQAGNDGAMLSGTGCSAADLCAVGWHVCQTKTEVAQSQPVARRSCDGLDAPPMTFFATAQAARGGDCTMAFSDDFAGCGTYGVAAFDNCAPLDVTPGNMCTDLSPIGGWSCPVYNDEVNTVTKSEPLLGGGVLCCKDV